MYTIQKVCKAPQQSHSRFPDAAFDLIVLKSVFTHLRPDAVQNYLKETRRMLSPDGRCLGTFFLLNGQQPSGAKAAEPSIHFKFGDDDWRFAQQEMPELAIAYPESRLEEMAGSAKLHIHSKHYGYWSGRPDGLSYQDIVLFDAAGVD